MQKLTGRPRKLMYGIWYMMHDRCENKASNFYHRYGGRGIEVCKRWSCFDKFLADVGPRPSPHVSLERKDNNKGYCPSNVVWATRKEQAGNTLNCVELEYRGETRIMSDWAEVTGRSVHLISQRLGNGWTVERALTEPPQKKPKNILIEFKAKKRTAAQWSKRCGVPDYQILRRISKGWSVEKALMTPLMH